MSTPASGAISFSQIRSEYMTTSGSMNVYNNISGKGRRSGLYYNVNIPKTNLILCYNGANPQSNPGSGTTINDVSGNGQTGTMQAGAVLNASGITLSGTTSYVTTPGWSQGSSVTIIAFVNQTALVQKAPIMSFASTFDWNFFAPGSRISATNPLMFWSRSSATWYTDGTTNSMNVNAMYGWSLSGSTLKFYRNGVLTSTQTIAGSVLSASSNNIGRSSTNGTEIFQGNIYNLLTWTRTLSDAEVTAVFNAYRSKFGL